MRMTVRAQREKIVSLSQMVKEKKLLKAAGRKLVFTNGCFDILHVGHVEYLAYARDQGDALAVAINSDASVKKNKGPSRPIVSEDERARLLAALEAVDYVLIFSDKTPTRLIKAILPDVLVKGADWAHDVVGREIVEKHGGHVVLAPLTKGRSTTNIIDRIMGSRTSALGKRSKADRLSHSAKQA